MSNQRILVIGGGGFLGSYVVEALLHTGRLVRILDRVNLDPVNIAPFLDRIELMHGDLASQATIDQALQNVDMVFHFASTTIPKSATEDPLFDLESNVGGMIKLLESARRHHIRKIIFSSSGGGVYGIPQLLPIKEDHPTRPLSAHAVAKLAIEKYLALYQHLYGLNYLILRFSNPYGPRQNLMNPLGAITHFLASIHHGKPIEVWGDGSVIRDYFYVRDLLTLIPRLLPDDVKNAVYNIGHGQGYSLNEILAHIRRVVRIRPRVVYKPGRKIDVPVNVLSTRKAAKELGWKATTNLETGLAETWGWIQGGR